MVGKKAARAAPPGVCATQPVLGGANIRAAYQQIDINPRQSGRDRAFRKRDRLDLVDATARERERLAQHQQFKRVTIPRQLSRTPRD